MRDASEIQPSSTISNCAPVPARLSSLDVAVSMLESVVQPDSVATAKAVTIALIGAFKRRSFMIGFTVVI